MFKQNISIDLCSQSWQPERRHQKLQPAGRYQADPIDSKEEEKHSEINSESQLLPVSHIMCHVSHVTCQNILVYK